MCPTIQALSRPPRAPSADGTRTLFARAQHPILLAEQRAGHRVLQAAHPVRAHPAREPASRRHANSKMLTAAPLSAAAACIRRIVGKNGSGKTVRAAASPSPLGARPLAAHRRARPYLPPSSLARLSPVASPHPPRHPRAWLQTISSRGFPDRTPPSSPAAPPSPSTPPPPPMSPTSDTYRFHLLAETHDDPFNELPLSAFFACTCVSSLDLRVSAEECSYVCICFCFCGSLWTLSGGR